MDIPRIWLEPTHIAIAVFLPVPGWRVSLPYNPCQTLLWSCCFVARHPPGRPRGGAPLSRGVSAPPRRRLFRPLAPIRAPACRETERNLVDPASSHTLVSKIKPCMSKYKHYTVKLRMAHYISYSLFDSPYYLDNRSNSRANTCANSRALRATEVFIRYNQPFGSLVNHNN